MAEAVEACRPHFLAAAVFSLFINLLFLAPAIYMLQVYDRVVATGGKMTLLFITLALAVALFALSALDAIRNRLLVRASLRLDALLAPKILKRMMGRNSNAAVQAMRDFETVRQAIGSPVAGAMFDVPWFPLFLAVAFLLHFWIGILATAASAILFFVAWRNQRATAETMQTATQAMAASQAAAQTVALNNDTVRALGMVGTMVNRQLAQRAFGLSRLSDAQFTGGRFSALSRFLRLFVQSAALGLGALLAIAGYISAGAIVAASILLSRALQPVEAVIGGWPTIIGAHAALRRLADVMSGVPAERIYTRLPEPAGRLEADQVGVRGPDGRPVLFGISFDVSPGEMLGVIGPSGAGKTTLAKVLAGAIPTEAGIVRIDGAAYSDWEPDDLARHIGYLPQEPSLFEGTIKENISRFSGAANGTDVDKLAVAAAQAAGAHELILKLPKGYDTPLGPLGQGLSSGQAQRVALARAFYGNPVLMILDEPNAFLDSDGEAALITSLAGAMNRGAAVILIAHRRSILSGAKRLLVLEGGRPKLLGPSQEVANRLLQVGEGAAG
ncbi:type I secretion system permease/ATPase [Sphingomonas daechungensis]|uniref:type I secretion system permease/ATPase n=1 Tax=Sphingomonas daechungensis TaxID=1176646 RepID=UPI0037849788